MPDRVVLVIDQGSQSTRALVVDGDLRVRARATRAVATRRPGPGRVEQDAAELAHSVRSVIDDAVSHSAVRPERAALVTQRSTILAWDRRTREPLTPALSWQDTRADLPPGLDLGGVQAITGLRASRHAGAPKMGWLLDHDPNASCESASGRLTLGPLASYLVQALTDADRPRVDSSNASRTLLFDYRAGRWCPWLLEVFGIPAELLPEPVANRAAFGNLDTPLGPVPLSLVSGDQSVVPFACGPVDERSVWVQLGTGAFVQRRATEPVEDLLFSRVWDDGSQHIDMVEGTVNGAAAAINWAIAELGTNEQALEGAGERGGQAGLPLFINAVGGLGSPDWRSDVAPGWLGSGHAVDRLAAVLESIAFGVNRNLLRLMDAPPARLVVSGGLARNQALCRALAGLTGLPVARPREEESSALGAAALLLRGSDGARPPLDEVAPEPCKAVTERFQQWTAEMDAL